MTSSNSQKRSSAALPQELTEDLRGIAAELGCELIHAELRGAQLRLILDHEDGVTIDHCTQFSRQAGAALDIEDFGPERYTLEVSSPGLDRELYAQRDYMRFVDSLVRVRFDDAAIGKRTVVGRLQSFEEAGGRITLIEDGAAEPVVIPLERVETARLEIEL